MGTLNLFTAAQVRQKIAEMQTHPERDLFVSPDGLEQCAPRAAAAHSFGPSFCFHLYRPRATSRT